MLQEAFSRPFNVDQQGIYRMLPPDAEGAFLLPPWTYLGSTYQSAVMKVFSLLRINDKHTAAFRHVVSSVKECPRKQEVFRASSQGLDRYQLKVMPGQFGLHYRGQSAARVQAHASEGEISLGLYEVGIMLITHPDRLANNDDLAIICAGDRYHDDPYSVPRFSHRGSALMLDICDTRDAYKDAGVATMFST